MNIKKFEQYYNSPQYLAKLREKIKVLKEMELDPYIRAGKIMDIYSVDPVRFIEDFLMLKADKLDGSPKPFFLWDYQKKLIMQIQEMEMGNEEVEFLVDKPREMGITWTICAFFLWRWLFTSNYSAFILSRTETEVDDGTRNAEGSIFGKIRWMLDRLPKYMIPESYSKKVARGTTSDMNLKLINSNIGSSLTGSSTNSSAGRSRRYSTIFVDEIFYIERFSEVFRSLQSVAKVKIFASTVKYGRQFEDFKKTLEARGHYMSLNWKDHPFKDQEWYDMMVEKAELMNDPDILREVSPTYAVSPKSQYYPGILKAKLESFEYDPTKPLYVSIDLGGKHDLTVGIWWQFDGQYFKCLDSYHNSNKPTDWYVPFWNPSCSYNVDNYSEFQQKIIELWRGRKKPVMYFGEADHFAARHPTNTSSAQVLAKLGVRLMYNQYGISHESRRKAMEALFPRMVFNRDSDGAMRVYDAIAQSRYAQNVRSTAEQLKPIHDDEIADFRAAAENGAVSFVRVLRHQRQELPKDQNNRDFHHSIIKMLRI
jgi:hypothetical protein